MKEFNAIDLTKCIRIKGTTVKEVEGWCYDVTKSLAKCFNENGYFDALVGAVTELKGPRDFNGDLIEEGDEISCDGHQQIVVHSISSDTMSGFDEGSGTPFALKNKEWQTWTIIKKKSKTLGDLPDGEWQAAFKNWCACKEVVMVSCVVLPKSWHDWEYNYHISKYTYYLKNDKGDYINKGPIADIEI